MRDILLTLILAGLLPWALFRPVVGAYVWAWLSIMNPHQLAYGFARGLPFAQMAAMVTMTGFLFSKQRKPLPINGGTVLLLLLTLWVTVTSFVAMTPPDLVWERWQFAMKILLMLFVTLMLLRGRRQIDILVWVLVLSVGFYGVKGGVWTILTGGGSRVWGPPGGMLQGNNELAVALVMLMPLAYYLMHTSHRAWVRKAVLIGMAASMFAILGTQSRGALLALLSMVLMLGLKGNHPVRTILLLVGAMVALFAFMPDSWSERMDTIQTYRQDSSAMSRIYTWDTLWRAALDRPLTGVGFRADHESVFTRYASNVTADILQGTVYVAHSIYFQALGEHGFVGLGLYLGLGGWTWFAAGRLEKSTRDDAEFAAWVPLLMRMCQVSIFGFAIGGAFLSLMLLDLPYYVVGVVILTHATVHEQRRQAKAAGTVAAPTAMEPTRLRD